jgi:hypothetical protein
VRAAVEAGDIDRLQDLRIGEYNSAMKALNRYREICIVALTAREKMRR